MSDLAKELGVGSFNKRTIELSKGIEDE